MNNINKKNNSLHKDIGQDDFILEVIEASKEFLIVVDFWAPWCGPCKTLGPVLEKVIKQTNGKAKLVKINIDENQELAAQLQIKSIPSVYAFKNGKIENAFQGSLPESEIIKFLEKSLGEKLEGNYSEIITNARNLLNEEKYDDSINIVEDIISKGEEKNEAIEILIKSKIRLNKHDEAKEIIDSLEPNMLNNTFIKSAINAYKLATNSENNKSVQELINDVNKNPLNIDTNKNLSNHYFNEKEFEKAFDILLNLFKKSKKENKEIIKKLLFNYFEILGDVHPQTREARRKLSSIIFS